MKRLMTVGLLFLAGLAQAATKNVVPRAASEGNLGTSAKPWAGVNADSVAVVNQLTVGSGASISTISATGVLTLATDLAVADGGTGAGTLTDGGLLLGSGTGAITALGVATNGQIPVGDGTTDPVLATITGTSNEVTVTNGAGTITLDIPTSFTMPASSPTFAQATITDPLGVASGGSGAGTFTDGGLLLGSGTGAFTALGAAGNGEIPIGDGTTDPVLATITGTSNEVTVTNGAGTITLDIPTSFTMPASSPTFSQVTSALVGNADTATALAANPADCAANQFANTIAASGALTCAALGDDDVPDAHSHAASFTATASSPTFAQASTTGGLDVGGTITAGSGDNVITTASGLLEAAKLSGTMPIAVVFTSNADCDSLTPAAVAELCYDTGANTLWVSTSTAAGGFAAMH